METRLLCTVEALTCCDQTVVSNGVRRDALNLNHVGCAPDTSSMSRCNCRASCACRHVFNDQRQLSCFESLMDVGEHRGGLMQVSWPRTECSRRPSMSAFYCKAAVKLNSMHQGWS